MRKKVLILFSIICIFIFILFVVFNFIVFPTKYKNYVGAYANKYGLEPAFVYAVIKAESDFDKTAKSSSGAMGLMQLIPSTASWIAEELGFDDFENEDLFNPEVNVEFGCFYLNYLFEKFNNMRVVVCAYNAGETIVRNWIDENGEIDVNKISYSETKTYLKRVLSFYNVYKNHEICV